LKQIFKAVRLDRDVVPVVLLRENMRWEGAYSNEYFKTHTWETFKKLKPISGLAQPAVNQ